jgi:dihydroxy-acid dehydratase
VSQERIARQDGSVFSSPSIDGFIARAFMRGAGHSAEEIQRGPVVGVCSSWSELNPCNGGLDRVVAAVKSGVQRAGGYPLVFPTISLSEPFSRPSSMLLRNLMSMDVEEMIRSSPLDAVVVVGGCDKTVPAQLMGAVSADLPTLAITAGPRPVGEWNGEPLTIDDLWGLSDKRRCGLVSDTDWLRLEGSLNTGFGTCNVMGTATTMSAIAEVLGFALPGTSLHPSGSQERTAAAERTGERAVALAREGTTAATRISPAALENAVRVVCALGGSTNALIHLSAIAGRAGIELDLTHVGDWAATTPVLADVRPAGRFLLEDLEREGGVPAVIGALGDQYDLTVESASGKSWLHERVQPRPVVIRGALRQPDDPAQGGAGIAVVFGSLAPHGAVIKRAAASRHLLTHSGPAVVFDGVDDLNARINDESLPIDENSVLVLRGVGPIGGPGMPEVGHLPIPTRLLNAGVTDMVRVSDARMSGTAVGTVVLHVSPESAADGPLRLVRDGDEIRLDVDAGTLDLVVPAAELHARAARLEPLRHSARGYAHLYSRSVLQAPQGCDFDFLRHERLHPSS